MTLARAARCSRHHDTGRHSPHSRTISCARRRQLSGVGVPREHYHSHHRSPCHMQHHFSPPSVSRARTMPIRSAAAVIFWPNVLIGGATPMPIFQRLYCAAIAFQAACASADATAIMTSMPCRLHMTQYHDVREPSHAKQRRGAAPRR